LPKEQEMWQWTRDWIKLRREHSSIRRGQLIDLFYDDDAYVYARQDATEIVIIGINRSGAEKSISVPSGAITIRSGARLIPLLGARSEQTITAGNLNFNIPANTAVAYGLR